MFSRLALLLLIALGGLAGCAPGPGRAPAPGLVPLAAPPVQGRHALSFLVLSDAGPAPGHDLAAFEAQGAGRVSVAFVARGRGAFSVRAICDGRARVRAAEGQGDLSATTPAWVPAGTALSLRVERLERARTLLELDPQTQSCALNVTPGGRPPWSLRLQRADLAFPAVAALDAPLPGCAETGGGHDPLARAMMATGALSATCPMPLGATRFLPGGLDALNARIAALTGRPLPAAALEAGDPDMPLDFSAAPRLDLIYLNYLNMNADFAGYVMARMLEWHAARGTLVRILVSDIMLTETDRDLFEGLAARYSNVQIQPYRMPALAADGFEAQFARLHRVTHVKLFATLARDPGRSVAIVGGRNIHEGYFFPTPRDLTAHPDLHQYDPEEMRITGGFTSYEDLELALHGDAQVRRILRHMGALWQRDHDTQAMAAPALGQDASAPVDGTMRHVISVPYADGAALEAWYAGLIDAAQHRIRIASPYLNLPSRIEAAMQRARDRGVAVDVVTTVRVREVSDFMVTGYNQRFANRHADWVRFFDYDPAPLLLHAKLIVIDDRLVIAGSVNLNQRSFFHDLENAVVALDRGLAARADALIDGYIAGAERVPPGQVSSRWMRFFSRFGFIERSF